MSEIAGLELVGRRTDHPVRTAQVPNHQHAPIPEGRVRHLAVSELAIDDETFMFRVFLNIGDLRDSIGAQGQQLPIIVRPLSSGKHQIISGFRRVAAIRALGLPYVAAIVRHDLGDEDAFRVSVLENAARKTYSDLDRACLIKSYQDRGFTSVDVARLLGLGKRQKNYLLSLLELPLSVQTALERSGGTFTATHALLLRQVMRRQPLDCDAWIRRCVDESLSVGQLRAALNTANRSRQERYFTSMFNGSHTDWQSKKVRLMPVVIDFDGLTRHEKVALRNELERMLVLL